jgi:hypothetical protein
MRRVASGYGVEVGHAKPLVYAYAAADSAMSHISHLLTDIKPPMMPWIECLVIMFCGVVVGTVT